MMTATVPRNNKMLTALVHALLRANTKTEHLVLFRVIRTRRVFHAEHKPGPCGVMKGVNTPNG